MIYKYACVTFIALYLMACEQSTDPDIQQPAEQVASDRLDERPATTDQPIDMTELTKFATRYAAAWSDQNPAAFASFYAETGTLTVNDGEPSVGRDAVEQTAREYMTAFPDMVVKLVEVRLRDDYVVFHWHWTGTNTGPGGTGNAVELEGYEEWTIDSDGLIVESLGHMDDAEFQRQLNAN